jgi:predicted aspartyl protease
MRSTNFNPKGDLIVVPSKIWGRVESKELLLAIDTASASTVIAPDVIEAVGYHPRDGLRVTSVRSAAGVERGYTLKAARFAALGFVLNDFEVHVFDLPAGFGINGLIGLSFLRHLDYEIRSVIGRISVRPAVAEARPS